MTAREHILMSLTTLAYVKIAFQKRNKIYIRKKVKSKPFNNLFNSLLINNHL